MKRNLHVLVIIFAFSQLNPMDRQENIFSLQDIKGFIKENPVISFIAAIGIPTFLLLCYKKLIQLPSKLQFSHSTNQNQKADSSVSLWIKAEDGNLIGLEDKDLKKYPVLDHYVARFGHVNSKDVPLKIKSAEGLDELAQMNIQDFLKAIRGLKSVDKSRQIIFSKKLEEASELEIKLPLAINRYITQFLQRLQGSKNLSFVVTHMLYHNMIMDNDYRRKHFFTNQKYYWQKEDGYPIFYDHDGNEVFRIIDDHHAIPITNGEYFEHAHNGSSILIIRYISGRGSVIMICNFETRKQTEMSGSFENFALSSDGHYVAVRPHGHPHAIELHDICDLDNIRLIATVDHIGLRDFAFSPDGSKLVSWSKKGQGEDKVVLWDLTDIQNINKNKKELLSGVPCTLVIFCSDNENICIIGGARDNSYDSVKNRVPSVKKGIILNIDSLIQKELSGFDKAYVFSAGNDFIIGENYNQFLEKTTTSIFNKAGEELNLEDSVKSSSFEDITKDYFFVRNKKTVQLLDYNMNCILQWKNADERLKLSFDSENVIVGKLCDEFGKVKSISLWPLPNREALKTVQSISEKLTATQFIFLETMCSQERESRESLILHNEHTDQLDKLLAGKNENIAFKTFTSFDSDHQLFLKEKLYLELPQGS